MGYAKEIILTILLLCLGIVIGLVLQTETDQQEHIRMIKESINFTENIPEKDIFIQI